MSKKHKKGKKRGKQQVRQGTNISQSAVENEEMDIQDEIFEPGKSFLQKQWKKTNPTVKGIISFGAILYIGFNFIVGGFTDFSDNLESVSNTIRPQDEILIEDLHKEISDLKLEINNDSDIEKDVLIKEKEHILQIQEDMIELQTKTIEEQNKKIVELEKQLQSFEQ